MRSSKSRSRSKSNRPRSIGNIINRVFDSSGPEGKVRGTPQQIIEKYHFLARDAQLSNDRVAAENFMQHAEHYTRMLAEAQRELAAEQDQRRPHDHAQGAGQTQGHPGGQTGQTAYQGGQGNPGTAGQGGQQHGSAPNRDRSYGNDRPDPRDEPQPDAAPVRSASMMDFIEEISDSGLVETPETRRADQGAAPRGDRPDKRDRGPFPDRGTAPQERRQDRHEDRRPRGERPLRPAKAQQADPAGQDARVPAQQPAAQAASAAAPQAPPLAPKKPRIPRKPRSDAPDGGSSGPAEAAE
ncbi:MAG: DUF4167 domain-containing protein [Rhodobacter sp.]|nr:DUF4167 domain-containing protein [Rhodobacter sp.]MCA3518728.1 DUF4167 domain-containing protein [Rhodobacter sp.]MCA3522770.1 DUF4167 domain-containing protein [Rhodobacter sp.]MCA3525974.1 DUF4167 domain-containing protein [Rhodobacter sp.]MCA3529205.1 DUF4167 domain-containing protein [Rhodobacter sp.]